MLPRYYPRHNKSYQQAISYVLREQVNHGFVITHNLNGETPQTWVRSFQENENKRRKKSERKNAVRLRHIVLPWSGNDTVTNEAMEDMTREFMRLYNPHAVYLAVAHEPDELHDHPHVHIIAGGTDRFGRAMHLINEADRILKQTSEAYQREHYPEYVHSQIEHGQKRKRGRSQGRDYWPKRHGTSYKDTLGAVLQKAYREAISYQDFLDRINDAGLITYTRRGNVVGIKYDNRKHRFRLFGITKDRLWELKEREQSRHRRR